MLATGTQFINTRNTEIVPSIEYGKTDCNEKAFSVDLIRPNSKLETEEVISSKLFT